MRGNKCQTSEELERQAANWILPQGQKKKDEFPSCVYENSFGVLPKPNLIWRNYREFRHLDCFGNIGIKIG